MTTENRSVAARALLIDFDGTLVNSIGTLMVAYESIVESMNQDVRRTPSFSDMNGLPLPAIARHLQSTVGGRADQADGATDILRRYRDQLRGLYSTVSPNIGAEEILSFAVNRRWRPIVVTSNERDVVVGWLTRNRLSALVYDVVAVEDVTRGKPDPEPYVVALARADCVPGQAVAVEDSLLGAKSAQTAGIPTIGFGPNAGSEGWPMLAGKITSLDQLRAWL